MITCTKCLLTKQENDFHKRSSKQNGHDSWCKECKSAYRRSYFEKNREKETLRARKKAWKFLGIVYSMDKYLEKASLLENKCEICGTQVKTLEVDHCHTTGKIRGLLCGKCNKGLGLFRDSALLLEKATSYLKIHD